MPKCILHVGMHKTGTTSIQNSLLNFENDKFLYARLGGDANHSVPIYSIFSEHPEKHFLNRTRRNNGTLQDYIDRIRNDLSSSIKAAGDRTLIISGEDIGVMAEDDIKRLADYLSAHCSSTQVIAYIRPPMSFMNSAFQQTVRSGRRTTLNLPKLYRNYRGSFEKFDTHFGRENVLLKPFDRKKLTGGDSVIDFCSTIGLEFPADRIHRANESSSREFISLVYQYNRYCEDRGLEHLSGSEAHRINNALNGLGSTKFSFAPSLLKSVLQENAGDIFWIEERMGWQLDDSATADSPTDVTSEEELLMPITGAREVLLRELAKLGWVNDTQEELTDLDLFHELREKMGSGKVKQAVGGKRREVRARRAELSATAGRGGRGEGRGREVAGPEAATAMAESPAPADDRLERRKAKLAAGPRQEKIRARERRNAAPGGPVGSGPRPLINADKNFMVYWSPKSACTTAYVWFSFVSGFADELTEFGAKIHKHRTQRFYSSELFERGRQADLRAMQRLRIIRDPYSRAVSIYRHALKTSFADDQIAQVFGRRMNSERGFSFQQFLDFIEKFGVWSANVHIKPQYSDREIKYPPTRFINISKSNMFTELNAFEADIGLPQTKFEELTWLHKLEDKRKSKQQPIEGEELDQTPFSRRQVAKLDYFPSYAQLLTAQARSRIESIYKDDFDAYRDYL